VYTGTSRSVPASAGAEALPHSARAAGRVLSLPMSADLAPEQQDGVASALVAAIRALGRPAPGTR
jgi:dTDP-4-amino-4,6-dideoxygalactose transaminase